jgi:hypothetical protein
MRFAALGLMALAGTAVAGEGICRSLSARWTDQGTVFRTTMWESGAESSGGRCHKIEHAISHGGVETALTGADCNCDLIADGEETKLSGAPHAETAARLKALCAGPVKTLPDRP